MTTLADTIRAIARRSGHLKAPNDASELCLVEGPRGFTLMERTRDGYRDDTPACRDPRKADGSRIPPGTVLLRSEVEAVVRALLTDDEPDHSVDGTEMAARPLPEPRPWREERADLPFSRTLRMLSFSANERIVRI